VTENTPEIIYPEMLEYAWAKDLDRVKAASKYVERDPKAEPLTVDKLPKSPINLVMAMLAESLCYPEIVEAHTAGVDTKRSLHLLMWFDEYLLHKYGNAPDARLVVSRFMRKIANGHYSGLNDGRIVPDLMKTPYVAPDDGADYAQPLPLE